MSRPSPTESATDFDAYTIRKGNDGNIYVNLPDKNKVLRWRVFCTVKGKKLGFNLELFHEIYSLITKPIFELIGSIKVEDKLSIGDSIAYTLNDFGKGVYYVYRYNQSLVASRKKLKLNSLFKSVWNESSVSVDYGIFVYRDTAPIKKFPGFMADMYRSLAKIKEKSERNELLRLAKTYSEKKSKLGTSDLYELSLSIPSNPLWKKMYVGIMTCAHVTIKDEIRNNRSIKLKKEEIEIIDKEYRRQVFDCKDMEQPLVIWGGNSFGDGSFPVVVDEGKSFIIQCGLIYNNFIARAQAILEGEMEEDNLLNGHFR